MRKITGIVPVTGRREQCNHCSAVSTHKFRTDEGTTFWYPCGHRVMHAPGSYLYFSRGARKLTVEELALATLMVE